MISRNQVCAGQRPVHAGTVKEEQGNMYPILAIDFTAKGLFITNISSFKVAMPRGNEVMPRGSEVVKRRLAYSVTVIISNI